MSKRESLWGKHGYAYGTLDAKEKAAYQQLYDAIANRDRIRLSDYPQLEPADISRLLACIDMDHPELFWLYNGIEMTLAVLENAGFKPIVKPSLEPEGKGDVVTEALDILSGRAKP